MDGLGTVVLGTLRLRITAIRLRGGTFVLIAEGRGPWPAFRGYCTVFGEDGRGVFQGGWVEIAEERHRSGCHLELPVLIGEVTNCEREPG